MSTDAVKDVIYQSCLVMDDEKFDEYLALCTQGYRVTPNGSPGTMNVTSALTIYFTNDRGDTKVFAIGRYNDVVDTSGATPRLKAREVRLETRSLGTGSQIPF